MLTLDLINTMMLEKYEPAKCSELSALKIKKEALDKLTNCNLIHKFRILGLQPLFHMHTRCLR